VQRIRDALRLRERFFNAPFYRLVYGDSDFLSGLVIDRFDDVLVVQIGAAGMERVKPLIVEALVECLAPRAIVWKNDGGMRELEGLPEYVEAAVGDLPASVRVVENGCEFEAPLADGQKTGWFYDHRDSRSLLLPWVKGLRVLDVFSYVGGWGIQAAAAGAASVTCVDSSAPALALVEANAARNHVGDRVDTLKGNAFDVLAALADEGAKYDVVILDPPAFIKRRKDFNGGLKAYHKLNDVGMRVVERDGLLVSASCSMHLARTDLIDAVRAAGRHVDRQVQIIAQGHQGMDHPVHPSIPETEYLKTLVARVYR
jgi:23S rRNA (cytosine1962-C5)-methyltransferase